MARAAMAKKRNISDLATELEAELGSMDHWSPEDWYRAAERIVDDPEIRTEIPSGNLGFLTQAVDYHRRNEAKIRSGEKSFERYAQGIKNHLQKALPGQWGHIAAGTGYDGTDINIYHEVLSEIRQIDTLSDAEIVELAREITTSPALNKVPGQESNMDTIQRMLASYDKRVGTDGPEAGRRYLHETAGSGKERIASIKNIIRKSYLPNLTTYIAKHTT